MLIPLIEEESKIQNDLFEQQIQALTQAQLYSTKVVGYKLRMQVSGKSKTGALHILKNVRHNLWKKYRFTLYSSFLAYYSDDEQMYPQGIIVLKHISSINNEEPSDRYNGDGGCY